jgi:hypothetical protein
VLYCSVEGLVCVCGYEGEVFFKTVEAETIDDDFSILDEDVFGGKRTMDDIVIVQFRYALCQLERPS